MTYRRARSAIALLVLLVLLVPTRAHAGGPEVAGGWERGAPPLEQQPPPADRVYRADAAPAAGSDTWLESAPAVAEPGAAEPEGAELLAPCAQAARAGGTHLVVALTDADLLAESDGSRLCLLWDTEWQSYSALLFEQPSAAAFRRAKSLYLALLPAAGVNPCQIASWSASEAAVRRTLTAADRYAAGQPCTPEVIAHGPESLRRAEETAAALTAAALTAEQVFRWTASWPLRVHLYDSQSAYVDGARAEGGDPTITAARLRTTPAYTGQIANGMRGFLVNTASFATAEDLRMLIAHEYAHFAQLGLTGCTCTLPWFAIEGGAELFASMVVGPEQRFLAARLETAVRDERAGTALPLRELVERPQQDDPRHSAGYSRGYAAMRFLAANWGLDAFSRVHQENIEGSPARFLERMELATGLTLDAFDAELSRSLRAERGDGRTTLRPEGLLLGLQTLRPLAGGEAAPADRFAAADPRALVAMEWRCLEREVTVTVEVIRPDGVPVLRYSGSAGPGCGERNTLSLPLDGNTPGGVSLRAFPGVWRAEVLVQGTVEGAVRFTVEP